MNKGELIAAVAEKAALTKKDAGKAIDAFVEVVGDVLVEGKDVQLIGFGTFGVRERAAREGRNPSTGEVVRIEAAKVPFFKAGKTLRESVNK